MTIRTKLTLCLAGALLFAIALPLVFHPNGSGILALGALATGIAGTVGFSSSSYTPDRLVVSLDDVLSRKVTLLSGQNCVRGTILGKIQLGGASETHAGNTGNGAMTLDGTTPVLGGASVGVYTVLCTTAQANAGVFRVFDPKGRVLGDYTVGAAAFADQIKFTIADGATDFIVGDKFLVTVAAGSGKYVKSLAAAIDGSEVPDVVLADDCNASAADADALVYFRGTFNQNAVTLGTGHTVASIQEGLRLKGIDLVTAQPGN